VLSGSARGKLLILGEYAVLFGAPALGLPLTEQIQVTLDHQASEQPLLPEQTEKFRQWLISREPRLSPLRSPWIIKGNLPQGQGFGSSAALCNALARACFQRRYSPEDLLQRTTEWENFFHSRSSGMDRALSLASGLSLLRREDQGIRVQRVSSPSLWLLVASIPRLSRAGKSIGRILQQAGVPGKTRDLIQELSSLTEELLSRGADSLDQDILNQGIHEVSVLLEQLELVHPRQQQWIHRGIQLGARAGKISGAGLGGAFFLTFSNQQEAAFCRDRLSREGLEHSFLLQA